MLKLVTSRETYFVNEENQIGRTGRCAVDPSKSWLFLGLVRYNNFGHIVERLSPDQVRAGIIKQYLHKNGKPRYHVVDNDHGTVRHWGQGLTCTFHDKDPGTF